MGALGQLVFGQSLAYSATLQVSPALLAGAWSQMDLPAPVQYANIDTAYASRNGGFVLCAGLDQILCTYYASGLPHVTNWI
jgi:hypothetical protein